MNIAYLRGELQRCLTDQALLEAGAAVTARYLARSTLLTPEERDFAGDRLYREESSHMRWALAAAAYLSSVHREQVTRSMRDALRIVRDGLTVPGGDLKDAALVARMHYDERFFVRRFRLYRAVTDRLLPPEIATGAVQVANEERGHNEWGRRVLLRLRAEYPEFATHIRNQQTLDTIPGSLWEAYPVRPIAIRFRNVALGLAQL